MTEDAPNHAECIRIHGNNDEKAVEEFPQRWETPQQGNSNIGPDNRPDSRQGRGHVGPKTVLCWGRLIVLGEDITEAEGEDGEYERPKKTLALLL